MRDPEAGSHDGLHRWDGLRDHTDKTIDDGLWNPAEAPIKLAGCLNRNCHYYRECPFFVARREIREAEVVKWPTMRWLWRRWRRSGAGAEKTCWSSVEAIICRTSPATRWRWRRDPALGFACGWIYSPQAGGYLHGAVSSENHAAAGQSGAAHRARPASASWLLR